MQKLGAFGRVRTTDFCEQLANMGGRLSASTTSVTVRVGNQGKKLERNKWRKKDNPHHGAPVVQIVANARYKQVPLDFKEESRLPGPEVRNGGHFEGMPT